LLNSNELSQAIEFFEAKNYNKALSIFRKILNEDPCNEKALYYTCLIYRILKKWSRCKKTALNYIKNHGKNYEILEILGDVYFFEGNYRKANKFFSKAAKRANSKEKKQNLLEKLKKSKETYVKSKNKIKIALIVEEGGDNFTDELVEGLSKYFWIRKFVISKNQARFYRLLCLALSKNVLNSSFYKFLIKIFPGTLRKAISWANVVWSEWLSDIAVAASYLKRKNTKLFIRLHRYEAFTEYPFWINWKNVDGIIFVAEFMKKILENRGVNLNTKVKVIYNGIDIEKLEFKNRKNGYNIGWVAYVHPRKNLHLAFEIIRKLVEKDPKYKLHIAGNFTDSMYEVYIKHLVKAMKLEKNVIFYGWIDDIDKWWEDKNYLLSTSIHESFGYNIAEAMAKGIKPIIHNFYNAKELYDDEFLFSSVDEAVEKIKNGNYDSSYYREYIIKKGWTLENQLKDFKRFIEKLSTN
jgi:glycosyltransferase involved in cell wall biosynthesis